MILILCSTLCLPYYTLHPCGGEASIHYHSWIFLNIPFHMVYFLVRNLFIIFCVYLHRDVQPVWNKYRLAGTNDSHQPEHEDSNFPARLSSIVGEERWCGGCRHVRVHMLYIHTVITPSCSTIVMVDKHTGLILHRIQCNHLKGYIEVTPLMFCNCMDFLSLFNKNS